jgi:hypothetical protein
MIPAAKEKSVRRASFLLASGVVLLLAPGLAAAERTAWNAERVGALAAGLVEQTQGIADLLRAEVKEAEAAADDPDREVGVGVRTVVVQDVSVLGSRAKSYRQAIANGQGRDETRSLYGRIDSLVSLTAHDMRNLPDFEKYRASFEALEKTVAALGGFYAESLKVKTPPDPLEQLDKSRP